MQNLVCWHQAEVHVFDLNLRNLRPLYLSTCKPSVLTAASDGPRRSQGTSTPSISSVPWRWLARSGGMIMSATGDHSHWDHSISAALPNCVCSVRLLIRPGVSLLALLYVYAMATCDLSVGAPVHPFARPAHVRSLRLCGPCPANRNHYRFGWAYKLSPYVSWASRWRTSRSFDPRGQDH